MSQSKQTGMIPAMYPTEQAAQKYYDRRAQSYDATTLWEGGHHKETIRLAVIRDGEHVLEVACGTGRATTDIAKAVGISGHVDAIDMNETMLSHARAKIQQLGLEGIVRFKTGNAKQLPYPDQTFDLLYNAYMFDLIPEAEFPLIMGEFYRVLKPGGRVVMLNLSKRGPRPTLFEWAYRKGWAGACRPVLMSEYTRAAGFKGVQRQYRRNPVTPLLFPALFGAEIVIGYK